MTMTTTQAIITIAAVVLGTMATRFIPFIIFANGTLDIFIIIAKNITIASNPIMLFVEKIAIINIKVPNSFTLGSNL